MARDWENHDEETMTQNMYHVFQEEVAIVGIIRLEMAYARRDQEAMVSSELEDTRVKKSHVTVVIWLEEEPTHNVLMEPPGESLDV